MKKNNLHYLLKEADKVLMKNDKIGAALLMDKLAKLLPSIKNSNTFNDVVYCMANLLEMMGKYEQVLIYFDVLIHQEKSYKFNFIGTIRKALCCMRLGRRDDGFSLLLEAYSLALDHDDYERIVDAARCIAVNSYKQGNYDEALEYINEAIWCAKKVHDKSLEYDSLYLIACVFLAQEKYFIALDCIRESIELAYDCKDWLHVFKASVKRCSIYLKLNKIEQAHKIIDDLSKFQLS